jgi:hypothetical protein
MCVRDHQLDPAQAAPGERAPECGPKGLGLGGANAHPQHLAPRDKKLWGERRSEGTIAALLQQGAKAHHLIGHRRFSGLVEVWRPNPTEESR